MALFNAYATCHEVILVFLALAFNPAIRTDCKFFELICIGLIVQQTETNSKVPRVSNGAIILLSSAKLG